MSRFEYDDYEEHFPNSSWFWMKNTERALNGRKGQAALRELEQALLDLPEPKLIQGRVAALDGSVCAMGALARKRRVDKGEDPQEVQRALSRLVQTECEHCWHGELDHGDGPGCNRCEADKARRAAQSLREISCPGFKDSGYANADGGIDTAEEGKRIGLTFVLSWEIAHRNDVTFGGLSPEERYEKMLAWVREQIKPEVVAA